MKIPSALSELPLIAILRGVTPPDAVAIATALINIGFRCIEVPLNSPEALHSIKLISEEFGSDVLIGAGTVTEVGHVQKIKDHGGKLIVMPHADTQIISKAKSLDLYCIPGFSTPTEAFAAIHAGADALKLFPAELHPPVVLKALRAVLPKTTAIFPVGGITPEAMSAYKTVGAVGFGLGSALYAPGNSVDVVTANAERFLKEWRKLQ